jgi:hypothetical protein
MFGLIRIDCCGGVQLRATSCSVSNGKGSVVIVTCEDATDDDDDDDDDDCDDDEREGRMRVADEQEHWKNLTVSYKGKLNL